VGSIRQTPSRTWEARYRDPRGRERSKTFKRKGDARRWLAKEEADKSRGAWIDPRAATVPFDAFARHHLDSKLHLRNASRARDKSLLENHVIPAFGQAPIGRITRPDVQHFITSLSAKALSPSTVGECHRLLYGIMSDAVDSKVIAESPCRNIKLPRSERHERHYLTPEQLFALADAVGAHHRALILTGGFLGLRWEELAGLQRRNLHLLRRQLRVVSTVERVGGTYRLVRETKTRAALRMLPVPPTLTEELARHLEHAPQSEFVFAARGGNFLRYDNFRVRVWNPAVVRAGLGGATFHSLRHTAAAILIDRGLDLYQLMRFLGHSSITTTENLYGHRYEHDSDNRISHMLENAMTVGESDRDVGDPWDEGSNKVVNLASDLDK
jgi:integrase